MRIRSSRFRAVLFLASVSAWAVVVSGCTQADPAPSSSSPHPTASSSSPAPAPSQTIVDSLPQPGASGEQIPAVEVPGLSTDQLSTEGSDRQYHLRWAVVPGATALNAATSREAQRLLDSFLADYLPGGVAPPELNTTGDLVLARGNVAGVRFTTYTFAGASGAMSHRTFYGDASGTWATTAFELTEPSKRAELVALVRARVGAPSPNQGDPVGPERSAQEVLSDLVIRDTGEVTIVVDEGVLGPNSAGTLSATLSASEAGGYLTERGRSILAAATSSTPYAVPAPATSPAPLVAAPPAGRVDCAKVACVALTYDDGPGPHTDRLLGILAAAKVPATFFVLGPNARLRPATIRRMRDLGMEVGNHTWNHRELTRIGDAARAEVSRTDEALRAILGKPSPLFRPPYGAWNAATRQLGHPIILWDVDTEDWRYRNAASTTKRALATVRAGSIILMHDIQPSSVDATAGIIAGLRKRGLTPVTVSQLLGTAKNGTVYYSRSRAS